MVRTRGEQPPDLIRMRRRLDEFRRTSAPGKSLPGWAWAAAARLARRYGVHRTGRALGLEYNKLKRTSAGTSAPATSTVGEVARRSRAPFGPVSFVELTGALPAAGGACRLRLAGPAGQHLELEMAVGAAKEVVLELCRSGWGARSQ